MAIFLIGLDDTDNSTSIGTGQLARRLCSEFGQRGSSMISVTRHQFLIDEAIAYTSHNSGACIELSCDAEIGDIAGFACNFVACNSAAGSDPGVCVTLIECVSSEVIEFGIAAMTKVLTIEQAFERVDPRKIKLRGLGGNCLGVIGALGSVGQRSEGNHGRFIDMPGLRELCGKVFLNSLEDLGIKVEYRLNGRKVKTEDLYDTRNWVRPSLIEGKPLLTVEWSEESNAWISIESKSNRRRKRYNRV